MDELRNIQSKIYEIRGQRVMLDFDLAALYHVTTSNLNKAVKRNIKRFPPDFMFQLTKEEFLQLKSSLIFQIGISNDSMDFENLKLDIDDILHDQNDINESTRAQLDAISAALAELQAKEPRRRPRRPIGFVTPDDGKKNTHH